MPNIPEQPRDTLMRKLENAENLHDLKSVLIDVIVALYEPRPAIKLPDLPYEVTIIGEVTTIKSFPVNMKKMIIETIREQKQRGGL